MPITDCKIHGVSGCPEMCKHLHKNLEKGIFLPFYTLPVYTIRMCMKCFEKYDIQEIVDTLYINKDKVEKKRQEEKGVYRIAPEYYFESAVLSETNPELLIKIKNTYSKLNKKSRFKCYDCIDDICFEHAKENNLELPFEPFENTILHSEDKNIAKLYKKLEKYFGNKGLDYTKRPRTCEISSGSISRPLSIRIYGVVTEEEQQILLDVIVKIFNKIPQKQRKIMFYEPLTWTIKKLDKGMKHTSRNKIELLKEFVVR